MSKLLFAGAAAAALGLVAFTALPARASWLSEAVHRLLDQNNYVNPGYTYPPYAYPPPVASPNYGGYPGYYYGDQSYPPPSEYYSVPYSQPSWGQPYAPGYYGRWHPHEHDWDQHGGDHDHHDHHDHH